MKIKFILIFIIFYCLNQSQITIADSNVFTVEDCLNDEENTNNNNQPKNVIDCASINSELSNCTCADDFIDCSKRNFKSIPTNLTQLPAQIKRLLFANNRIKSLFALDFGNKSSIKITVINLKKNLIDYVDPDFFSTANIYESLNVLSFCGNSNLTSLNNLNSSVSFNKLETLEINNLRAAFEINDNFFINQRFPALTKLDLNNVSLIYKKQPFTNLNKMQSLRLDSNDLKQMPCQSISQMTSLGVLNLNSNKIKQTSNVVCLKNLNSLNQLHLSSNSLTNSDIEMIDFPANLEVLDLSNNLIDNFPDKLLQKVKNLNFLRIKIKQDKFMSINQEEAAWSYMTHLDLTDSIIYQLPEKAFVNLSLIISDLILKNCHLNEIHPDAFFGLSSLFGVYFLLKN
jgi:Leucine-rich repeat (LRR) protein